MKQYACHTLQLVRAGLSQSAIVAQRSLWSDLPNRSTMAPASVRPCVLAIVLASVLSMMPFQAAFAQESISDKADIVDTAIAAGDFTTLVELVQAAGLEEALRGEGPFTVFAPTDAAFAAVPPETLDALANDPAALESVLLYHVVPGRLIAALISDGKEVTTVQGETALFSFADGVKKINKATIVGKDIQAANGVIHVIDSVILPPSISGEVPAEGEENAEGGEAAAGEATVEGSTAMTATVANEAGSEATPADIVDTAVASGSFTTLVAAVQAAGLVDALQGEGPFTVFAPTDDAFAMLPQETIDALLADPTGDLTQILLYHVLSGKVMAGDLSDGLEADTLQGEPLLFALSDAGATVNEANIIVTDIETSNGVIHVIDSVLLPPADEVVAEETPAAATADDGAPEQLPVTGAASNSGALIAALVLAAVGAAAIATRRRMA